MSPSTRRRRHRRKMTNQPSTMDSILSDLQPHKSDTNFSEEFIQQNITIQDGNIIEDVYTRSNRNGKQREKQTHRIIPIYRRIESRPYQLNHPINTDTMSPLLPLRNRMPTPAFVDYIANKRPVKTKHSTKRRSKKHSKQH
jgi:hypothetical protein